MEDIDLTRKISMLLMDTKLADIDDCGSNHKHYLKLEVTNKEVLKRFSKRYHLTDTGLELIDVDDESLIGETLIVPTPTTCASNEGICRKCYGELFEINKDLNIGMIAVLILTDPLTQRLLSAKHLLETRSSKIEWGEDFTESFVVNRNLVTPKNFTDTIIIKDEDYVEDEEQEDEQVFTKFTIKKTGKRGKEIPINSQLKLFLNKELSKNMEFNVEENQYEIPLNTLEEGDHFAYFVMENNELSKPLREIKDLIETNRYIKELDVNGVVNYFLYLLNEAGINIQSVHMELIVREMIQLTDPNREQFKEKNVVPYDILRITDANLKGRSLSRSLLFERIKGQLTTLDYNTFEKNDTSILDKLL